MTSKLSEKGVVQMNVGIRSRLAAYAATLTLWTMFSVPLAPGQQGSNVKELQLASEYKQNSIEDISQDGKLLLLYQSKTRMQTFNVPLDGRAPTVMQKASNDTDVLRIVDLETGRELARTRVGFYPDHVQFINGTRTVFYVEPASGSQYAAKLWDYDQNVSRICANDISGSSIHFLSTTRALAIVRKPRQPRSIGSIKLPDCNIVDVGLADPEHPERGLVAPLVFSSHGHMLYKTDADEMLVRDTETQKVLHRFVMSQRGLYLGSYNVTYTPDGKQLLLVGSNTVLDSKQTDRYLLFYDAATYELVRKETVTAWRPPILRNDRAMNSNTLGSAWSISPNGEIIAIADTTADDRVAFVSLYDLKTLKKIAQAAFPAVRVSRDNPFAARISRLFFTPDGQYLIASTDATRVWRVK